jgi:hypothetical protein
MWFLIRRTPFLNAVAGAICPNGAFVVATLVDLNGLASANARSYRDSLGLSVPSTGALV